MSLTSLVVVGLVVVGVVVFLAARGRRKNGVEPGPLGRLVNALYNRVRATFGYAADAVTNVTEDAELNIQDAKRQIQEFKNNIINLVVKVKEDESKLPSLRQEVKKWEEIYKKATAAGDTDGSTRASRALERADGRLELTEKSIGENRTVVDNLEAQRRSFEDSLDNAELLKERLVAQHASASLRQQAISSGNFAYSGLGVLKDLQAAVDKEEARADAVEEFSTKDDDLQEKYAPTNEKHAARLATLRGE